ncbi:MAG TPA: hypothetical protein VMM60_16995 [Ilumatobacter sp.]|nr:hypothetical protein [Ilumatobacter sp.]
MDTYSVAEVAARLGTSVPRVRRAMAALRIEVIESTSGVRLDDGAVRTLTERLGATPTGWPGTREEAFVLAALSRRPLGLRSTRAVARAARVSPTTAALAVDKLMGVGLIAVETIRIVEGKAVDADVFVVDKNSEAWRRLSAMVRAVILPADKTEPSAASRVPQRLWHHFWNAQPVAIKLPDDERYVASRLLQSGDPQAIAWAVSNLSGSAIESVAELRGLTEAERATIRVLAGAGT